MTDGPYAVCNSCGAKVPWQLLVDHLAEHGYGTRDEIREAIVNAPIIDMTGEPDEPADDETEGQRP